MLKEFKDFIARGNVVDLAVAVVIGVAFGAVVTSFTDDILMQIIAAIGGEPDFSAYSTTVNGAEIRWGTFINSVVSFLIIGFALFLVVKAINVFHTKEEDEDQEDELDVLKEIRDSLSQRS